MTERPILFSAPMVRAILDGTKTQTRRATNVRDVGFIGGAGQQADPACWGFEDIDGCWHVLDQSEPPWHGSGISGESYAIMCPYGVPGNTLWVRETWADSAQAGSPEPGIVYRATDPDWSEYSGWKWRPSIFMPRSASRLTLRVTSVRVERVQDISEADARAEGVLRMPETQLRMYTMAHERPEVAYMDARPNAPHAWTASARESFERVWDSINGARPGCSWADSPWVWCVGFERVEGGAS